MLDHRYSNGRVVFPIDLPRWNLSVSRGTIFLRKGIFEDQKHRFNENLQRYGHKEVINHS